MRLAYDVATIRAAEGRAAARLGPGVLMQRAAAGLAATTATAFGRVYGTRVVVLAGSGDNGSDALHAGARLARRGARVDTYLADPARAHAEGLSALRAAGGQVAADLGAIRTADVVLDGIVGIGGRGGLRPAAAELVGEIGPEALVVAVDLPSGVDADTGEVAGTAVRADLTVTFGTYKAGLLVDPGASHAGVVELVDIGLDLASVGRPGDPAPVARAWQSADVRDALPRASAESDKYARGVVGVLAGSSAYTGAAVLAVGGAVRGGAGMVRAVGDAGAAAAVRRAWPEAVVTELGAEDDPRDVGRVQAWVAGPGAGTDLVAARRLDAILATDVPVLVDADGLTILAERAEWPLVRSAPTIFTPHAGELARLLGVGRSDVEAARLGHARLAVDRLGVTVLLKGSTTIVASPSAASGPSMNPTGTPALATAGSGDVLAGLVGALLASGAPVEEAAACGAYLHGLAGRLAAGVAPISAGQLLDEVPGAYERLHTT